MNKNRLEEPENEPKKAKKVKDNKIWAVVYKERKKFTYITSKELKDLIDIDRIKITGKYQVVNMDGLEKKVWVDAEIKLSEIELRALEIEQMKPKDYKANNETEGWFN